MGINEVSMEPVNTFAYITHHTISSEPGKHSRSKKKL